MGYYLFYRLGIFLAVRAPVKIAYRIAVFIADIHFLISKKDREAVMYNLGVVLARDPAGTYEMALAVFRNFAKYLVDFFRFAKIDDDYIKKNLKLKNIGYLDDALKKGRGAIVMSAHLGNWEMGGALLSKMGYPVSVVALDHRNKLVNSVFVNQRRLAGVDVISTGIAVRRCFGVLKDNGILGLLGDRDFTERGIEVKFFGRAALMPKGPAAFSVRTGAPIVPTFLLREPDGTFTLVFDKTIECEASGDSDRDIRIATERVASVLEEYIAGYPDQWCTFRRFWH